MLSSAEVDRSWLDAAIAFVRKPTGEAIARRLSARLEALKGEDGIEIWRLFLPDDFALNIDQCLLVLVGAGRPGEDVRACLRRQEGVGGLPAVIVAVDAAERRELQQRLGDAAGQTVVVRGGDITRLMLSPDPLKVFAQILAGQMSLARISPYVTRGGIARQSAFFGRTALLAHVLNREPANYLLVGGRQIGKSSFLKALQRGAEARGLAEPVYLSVGDTPVMRALATALAVDEAAVPERLRDGTRRLVLLDEADLFVAAEPANDYRTLHLFRNLAEEGHCFFVLAGFWRLFELVSLDYHSPIKNFGETLRLEALEPEACRALIREPMAALNIAYESEALVERIAAATGGRANLIAIACNELLTHIDPAARVIDAAMVERALNSEDIDDALGGWQKLVNDEAEARLDRIIVYLATELAPFSRKALVERLAASRLEPPAEAIDRALRRLDLAFILGRQENRFALRVPLFEAIAREEAEAYLPREIARATADWKPAG